MKNIFLYYKNVYFLAVLGQHFNEISEIGLLISVLVVGTKKKNEEVIFPNSGAFGVLL